MKKQLFLSMVLFPLLWSAAAFGAELKVAEGTITTQIVNRAPVDAVQTYPASVDKLYCFTRLTGAAADTTVTHVWYFGDQEMSRVTLPVRSSDWRTWSSKRFCRTGPANGAWRCSVPQEKC